MQRFRRDGVAGWSVMGALCALGVLGALGACTSEPTGPGVGMLTVGITGLPGAGANFGDVRVSSAKGFSRQLARTDSLGALPPGEYTITANRVILGGTSFDGTPASQTVEITGGARDSAGVTYRASTGSIDLYVGAAPGVTAVVRISGPNGYASVANRSTLITGLEPGDYVLSPDTVQGNGYSYAASPVTVAVQPSIAPAGTSISMLPITGAVRLDVQGLPSAPGAVARLTGPDGFERTIDASMVLTNLPPGNYSLVSEAVVIDGVSWRAASTAVVVSPGYTSSYELAFLPVAEDGSVLRNLRVRNFTLTQVVQREDNSIPMIAGRSTYLRVFLLASTTNADRPSVRARFFRNGALVDSVTFVGTPASVPTEIAGDAVTGTWDVPVPSELVKPGLGVQVEVDPDHEIVEATRSDNVFPATGPQPMSVIAGWRPPVVLVPVMQSATGLTGDASVVNRDNLLSFAARVYPVTGFDASVHEVYTTSAPALDPNDASRAWTTILSEINARRVAEGSQSYYLGVVRVNYTSGIAGLGYIGGRAAIGWDYSQTVAGVLAHELGHNFGRYHSPCGNVAGADPGYPYPNAYIGVVGWDAARVLLLPTTTPDLMSYCHPEWISDYTYMAVVDALASAASATIVGAAVEPCLLFWGRIENGVPVLEPAFELSTRPSLPSRPGSSSLRALAANGEELFALSFQGDPVADVPGAESFAFAVPLSMLRGRPATELRLRSGAGETRNVSAQPRGAAADPQLSLTRRAARQASLRWNAAAYPMVLVRDRRTGEVLSFARGGDATVHADRDDMELIFSDRVGSVRRIVAP